MRCPTRYGGPHHTKPLPRAIDVHVGPVAKRLVFYGNNLLRVLAPQAWRCAAQIGADGSAAMRITHGSQAIGVQAIGHPSGDFESEACSLFADAHPPVPCTKHPPARERVVHLNRTAVAFSDPPGVHGTGQPSGGSLPANGIMLYNPSLSSGFFFEETCVLAATQHTLCTVLLNDALTRAPR